MSRPRKTPRERAIQILRRRLSPPDVATKLVESIEGAGLRIVDYSDPTGDPEKCQSALVPKEIFCTLDIDHPPPHRGYGTGGSEVTWSDEEGVTNTP